MLIRHKLILNTIMVALAMLVLSSLFYYYNQTKSRLSEAQRMVLMQEVSLLSMRSNEKNFLMRKDVTQIDRMTQELGHFHQLNRQLQQEEQLAALQQDLIKLDELVTEYGQRFATLTTQMKKIGLTPQDGLYGALRAAVHNMESILTSQDPALLVPLLQLRRHEKDFMLRLDAQYVTKFEQTFSKFNASIKALPADQQATLSPLADQYHSNFMMLVDEMTRLGLNENAGMQNEMRSTVHQTDELFARTHQLIDSQLSERSAALERLMLLCGLVIFIGVATMSLLLGRSIDRPISRVNDTVNRIRQDNDLRLKVALSGKDEMAQLAGNLDIMLDGFRQLLEEVKQSANLLNQASGHLSRNIQRASDGAHRQLQETDMVATASHQMGSTIEEIARNTELAANNAQATNHKAQEGQNVVQQTVERIGELATRLADSAGEVGKLQQASQTIGSVLDVIRSIAEQTNLLALNAAIEAARAGEQGRGFAVVADEVRLLATRTQQSTQEISTIITSLQQQTGSMVVSMEQSREQGIRSAEEATNAGVLLEQIALDVTHIMDMSTQIAAAIEEQSLVAQEVNRNVSAIRDIAEESSQMAAENAESSQELSQQAHRLDQAVARYKV
jgi:methyl-accepting chemotaxis protein